MPVEGNEYSSCLLVLFFFQVQFIIKKKIKSMRGQTAIINAGGNQLTLSAAFRRVGAKRFHARRRQPAEPVPGAAGGPGVDLLPLEPSGVQQGRVLGPTEGRRRPHQLRSPHKNGHAGSPVEQQHRLEPTGAVPAGLPVLLPSEEHNPVDGEAPRA